MPQDFVQVVAVGVRDEGLSELPAAHEPYNLFHPRGIQLVEDVIEEQDGSRAAARAVQELELGQLQGNEVRLVLSLAAFTLHGVAAQRHLQVILVDAVQGVAHGTVLMAVALYGVEQGATAAVRDVGQCHLLAAL